MCNECINYEGDSTDSLIKFIAGHHPACPAFKIDKETFFTEFSRIVGFQVQQKLDSELIKLHNEIQRKYILRPDPEKEISQNKILKKLHSYLRYKCFPIVPNSYIYSWESDLLAVNKESRYITEYEVKISRNDFKADFKKFDKHGLIGDCHKYKFSSDIPNYLYYATPPGLLDKSEIPIYSGLIEIGIGVRVVKRAPILHKNKIDIFIIDKLLKKVYYKYWNIYEK